MKKRYKGTFVAEIRPEHVGRPFSILHRSLFAYGWGRIGPADVGKRLHIHQGVVQMEGEEQRDRRRREEGVR